MPYYADLKKLPVEDRVRTLSSLKLLRAGLTEQIPARTATDTLLLATWNLREFDKGKYGRRSLEDYVYISEILSRFDLIALQEIRGMYPLQQLKQRLGSWWDFLVTDVTLGRTGVGERMAFLYDTRKVRFTGLAAELVLPKADNGPVPIQLARTPYIAGFRTGWANLTLATVHIYYGKSTANEPRRLQEITDLANLIAKNAASFSTAPVYDPDAAPAADDLIILGDFNIFKPTDQTMTAIADAGFVVPPELQNIPGSNVKRDRHYDQIAYHEAYRTLKSTGNAGVFDFFEFVYRHDQAAAYAPQQELTHSPSFADWRTYRMSDHLPMWIELGIDDSHAYLDKLLSQAQAQL